MTIAELITEDLVLIEDALLGERLSGSLKRAAGDILGWFMAFIKIIIAHDRELRHTHSEIRKRKFSEAVKSLQDSLKSQWQIESDFKFGRFAQATVADSFHLKLSLPKVPSYWRIMRTGPFELFFNFEVYRKDKFWVGNAGGSFGGGMGPDPTNPRYRIPFIRIHMPVSVPSQGLSSELLSQIKPKIVTVIYHELQHFYQGPRAMSQEYRYAMTAKGQPRHYYLDPAEVDAVSTSIYRKARNLRQPLETVLVQDILRAAKGKALKAKPDPDFARDYTVALIKSLEAKYPQARGKVDLERVLSHVGA